MSKQELELFLDTARKEQLRELGEQLGIMNDDQSFDDLINFLNQLVGKKYGEESRSH